MLGIMKENILSDPYDFFERVEETIKELVIKKERNSQKPVNHHYVPRSFQERFGGPNSSLFAYIFKSKKIHANAQPSRIGSVPHLYTLPNDDGSSDVKVEHFFGVLEDRSAPIIEKVIKQDRLTEEERFWLCFFWGASFCRSHHMIRSARHLIGDLQSYSLRQRYFSLEKTRHLLGLEPPEDPSITAEEVFKLVHSNEYEVAGDANSVLPMVLNLIPEISQFLWLSCVVVLKAPKTKSFVTGDSPVVLLPMDQWRPVGFGLPGVARVMPLSWDTCLISYSPGRGVINAIADREQVRQINLAIAGDAHEFILGKSQKLLESIVDATGAKNRVWKSSFSVSR